MLVDRPVAGGRFRLQPRGRGVRRALLEAVSGLRLDVVPLPFRHGDEAVELTEKQASKKAELDALYARWEELEKIKVESE